MTPVVDCCVQHAWASEEELYEYLPEGWRQYMLVHVPLEWRAHLAADGPRPADALVGPLSVSRAYRNPFGDHLDGTAGGTDPATLIERHLDAHDVERALLCPAEAALVATIPTVRLAVQVARAVNDWTIDRWLRRDARLTAALLVPTQAPQQAAAEIRRRGDHDQIAAVLMAATGLAKPFGHPVYDPIHEAAHEVGLPIVLMAGGDGSNDTGAPPLAGGAAATYAAQRTLAHQSPQSHVSSLITQGVTNRLPNLRFLVLGGGAAWVTPWLWRLDTNHRSFRYDALWLGDRLPSEIFRRHFLVGTHPFPTAAPPARLRDYLDLDPGLADLLCYASGYPDWDSAAPPTVLDALPAGWGERVARDNARRLFADSMTEVGT